MEAAWVTTTSVRPPYYSETVVGWSTTVHEPIMLGVLCFNVPPYEDDGDDEHFGTWVHGEYIDGHWAVWPDWRDVRERRQQRNMRYLRSFAECPWVSVKRLEGNE